MFARPLCERLCYQDVGGRGEATEDAEIREGMGSWLAGREVKVLKVFKIW
jgi:hypothetical protein